jgi:penicillin-binding protein activator
MKKTFKYSMFTAIIIAFAGCTTQHSVQRINTGEQIDLSGRWNDSDAQMTADALSDQLLNDKWVPHFEQDHNAKQPILVVGLVKNKSHEHIDAETFIKDIEKAIIKNGSVRLVQAGDKREELRGERGDQQEFSTPETIKKWGRELGADFILQGTINSIVDTYNNRKVIYYQVDLELTNLENNEIVWMGDKKIKKFVEN